MSTCDRCFGNPCKCCEHRRAPGTCVECESDRATDLEERVSTLEEQVAAQHEEILAMKLKMEQIQSDVRERALQGREVVKRRGVDFPCEGCSELKGSTLQEGWYRCNKCGYPGK